MAALPYMQLYVSDYLADTAHLSTVEHGAYLLLLFNYWQRGESFKAKNEQTLNARLATVARMSNDDWNEIRETIEEFFEVTETEWRHPRIDRDLMAVSAKSDKARAAGKASASKRSTNVEQTLSKRSTNSKQTLNHTDTDTDTEKEKEKIPKRKKSTAVDLLSEFGIDGNLAEDFLQHRKAKNAPVTKTAMEGFKREAEKARMPIDEAVRISIERNWQGFKAEWLTNGGKNENSGRARETQLDHHKKISAAISQRLKAATESEMDIGAF